MWTGAEVRFTHGELPPPEALVPGALDALFRIAQEALNNVARHARARRVKVSVRALDGGLQLAVADDGIGTRLTVIERGHVGNPFFRGMMAFADETRTMRLFDALIYNTDRNQGNILITEPGSRMWRSRVTRPSSPGSRSPPRAACG